MAHHYNTQYIVGALLMMCSSFLIACISLFGKHLTGNIDITLLLFLRFLLPGTFLAWVVLVTKLPIQPIKDIQTIFVRSLFVVLSQYSLFFYLSHGSIMDGTLLYMTSPLFMPIIAYFYLKQRISTRTWYSIILGFLGIAFILKPTSGIINSLALVGLGSGICYATAQVAFHKLAKQGDANSITLYVCLMCAIIALVPLIIFWDTDTVKHLLDPLTHAEDWLWMFMLAFISISNQNVTGRAFNKVKRASSLSPYMYISIVFAGVFDWLFYDHIPDIWSILGAVLVTLSGIIMFLPKKKRKKRKPETPVPAAI